MEQSKDLIIHGEMGGGKGGGGHTPVEANDTLDSKQTVRILLAISEGEISGIDDILLNSVSISNYPDNISYELRNGTADQAIINGFSEVEAPISGAGTFPAPVTHSISKTYSVLGQYDAIRLTLMIDRLMQVTDQGDRVGYSASLSIYRRTQFAGQSPGNWQLVTTSTKNGKCTNPYTWDIRVQKPVGVTSSDSWGIMIVRDSADDSNDKHYSKTYIQQIITITEKSLTYPKTALVGITIKDAALFNGQVPEIKVKPKGIKLLLPSNYNPVTRQYNETTPWNGAFKSVTEYTNNLSWVIYWSLCHPDWGYGVSQADIDLGTFYTFAKYCDEAVPNGLGGTEPRYQIDIQFFERLSPAEYFTKLLNLGNANWSTNQYGQITLVWDSAAVIVDHIVTNADVIDGIFDYSSNDLESRTNLVNVTYSREDFLGDSDTVSQFEQTLIDRYGLQTSDIILEGCISESQAMRKARWALYTNCYQTNMVSFRTGIRGGLFSIGQICSVMDSENLYSTSRHAKIISATLSAGTVTATLDRSLTLTNDNFKVEYFETDGITFKQKSIPQKNGSFNQITWTSSILPFIGSNIILRDSNPKPLILRVIKTVKNEEDYTITGIIHNDAKYTYVDNIGTIVPPSATGNFSNFSDFAIPAVTSVTIDEIYVSTATLDVLRLNVAWLWTVPANATYIPKFDISYRRDNQEFITQTGLTAKSFDIENPLPGQYEFYIWAVHPYTGLRSAVTTTVYNFRTVSASSTLLPPENFYIANTAGTTFSGKDAVISWTYPIANDTKLDNLKDYVLQILDFTTETIKATYIVPYQENKGGVFTLSLDQNIGLFGTATRKFKARIYSRDLVGDYSTGLLKTFENTAPVVSTFSVSNVFNAAYLKATIPTDLDVVSYTFKKYDAATGGTLLGSINSVSNYVDFEATAGTTYYYTATANDVYGAGTETSRTSGTAISVNADTYTYTGLTFKPNSTDGSTITANAVYWSSFVATKNGTSSVTVAAGTATWSSGILYLYYVPGNTTLQSNTSLTTAIAADGRILATYKGGTDLTADAGRAFTSGDMILAGTVGSASLVTNTAVITNMAQIGNILQSDNYSNSGTYTGWRLDKSGALNANSITIKDSSGNLIFATGSGLNWNTAGVYGSNKPADGATVGANSSNLDAGIGTNLFPNSEFAGIGNAAVGWNPSNAYVAFSGLESLRDPNNPPSWRLPGSENFVAVQYGPLTTSAIGETGNPDLWIGFDVYLHGTYRNAMYGLPVSPGKKYEISVYVAAHRAYVGMGVDCFDINSNYLSTVYSVSNQTVGIGGTILSNYTRLGSFFTAPANAAYISVYLRKYNTQAGQTSSVIWATKPYFAEALPAQTTLSNYSIGPAIGAMSTIDKITSDNASTYIANAAIQTAQIADASINNAKIADAAITNAKIGTAAVRTANIYDLAVDTLKIAGNAVIVPVTAYASGSATYTSSQWVTMASAAIDLTGSTGNGRVIITISCSALFNNASSGPTNTFRLLKNGVVVTTLYSTTDAIYDQMSGNWFTNQNRAMDTYVDTLNTTATYTLQYSIALQSGLSVSMTKQGSMSLLGAKSSV